VAFAGMHLKKICFRFHHQDLHANVTTVTEGCIYLKVKAKSWHICTIWIGGENSLPNCLSCQEYAVPKTMAIEGRLWP
jgi:hypothetical protein